MPTMLFLLAKRKKLSSMVLPFSTPHKITNIFPSHIHPLSCFSTSATQNLEDPKPHFMVDYLVSSFGFSPDKATRISKPLIHLKSPEKPDSVIDFLEHQGFAKAHIATFITWRPNLLVSSPENTLAPNLTALRDMGLSSSILTQILLFSPSALHVRLSVPRLKFWKDFLGGDEAVLLKAVKQNRGLITRDITLNIAPSISLLHSHGLSKDEIVRIVLTVPGFMSSSLRLMESLLNRAKELGFQPGSRMFVPGLNAVVFVSKENLGKKMELLKSFGWSEDEFLSVLRRAPTLVTLTENYLRTKMDFLVGEVRCNPSYIVSCPVLLLFSLEKRLRPRHRVLHLLESMDLSDKKLGFSTAMKLPNTKFIERFILPHKEEITDLHEAYLAACA